MLAAAALAWARRGYRVFPLRPLDKRPLLTGGFHIASDGPAQVMRWWRRWPKANIGFPTGQPRQRADGSTVYHFVLDIDRPDLAARLLQDAVLLQQVWAARTPQKDGAHLHGLARQPVGIVPLVDDEGRPIGELRGSGGYVVLPPSRLPGGPYVWASGPGFEPIVVEDALAWALEFLRQYGLQARPAAGQKGEEVDLSRPIPKGRREITHFRTFRSLVARGMPPAEAAQVVRALNETRTEEPLPEDELERQLVKWACYAFPDGTTPAERLFRGNGHAPTSELAAALPIIAVTPQAYDLAQVVDQAWQALLAWNEPPRLFRQGEAIVELGEDGPSPVTAARLRELLARAASWQRPSQLGPLPVPPPEAVAQAMAARPHPELPPLAGVVKVPALTAEGDVIARPGYHAESGLYYTPGPGLEGMPPLAEAPSAEEVAEAKRLILDELLGDFPFDSQASRAGAVALLLTPFLRLLVDGPTPLFLLDKPTPGSGASLLATVASLVATGEEPTYLPPREAEEEWRKAITSALLRGAGMVLVDNARHLASSTLSSAVTASVWSDRLLGHNRLVSARNLTTWVATGNNPRLSLELARRCVRVRLEPPTERPWLRAGFRHPRLLEWARAHRARLVWACLTLIRHWLALGRPSPARTPALGMFESWAQVVGGVLEAAGIEGFLENAQEVYEEAEASPSLERARALVAAWWRRYGEEPVTARQVLEVAWEEGLEQEAKDAQEEQRQARRLGPLLRRLRGKVFDLDAASVQVCRAGGDGHTKTALWRLRRLGEPPAGPEFPDAPPREMREMREITQPPGGGATSPESAKVSTASTASTAKRENPDTEEAFSGPENARNPSSRHLPHLPRAAEFPDKTPDMQGPPHPRHGCERCKPAPWPWWDKGYRVCYAADGPVLIRTITDPERHLLHHILPEGEAVAVSEGLLRETHPIYLLVDIKGRGLAWIDLREHPGQEIDLGERQRAWPLSAFALEGWHLPARWGAGEFPNGEFPNGAGISEHPREFPNARGISEHEGIPEQADGREGAPCQGCGCPLPLRQGWGRPPRWCSDACRKRAARRGGAPHG